MATTELKVIKSICEQKDIHVLMGEDNALFGPFADIVTFMRDHYTTYKGVPEYKLLLDKFPDLEDVEVAGSSQYLVDQLKKEHIKTKMQKFMLSAAEGLERKDPAEILTRFQTELAGLGKYTTVGKDINLTDIEDTIEHVEKVQQLSEEHGGTPGIPTGIPSIDRAYPTGMAAGHLIVAFGYTGKAKSFFTLMLACRAWAAGYSPMIISLEMSPEEVRERAYAIMSSGLFPITDMSRGEVSIDDLKEWGNTALKDKPAFYVPSNQGISDMTPNVIQARIDKYRPQLVVYDYMQLGSDNAKTREMTPKMMNQSRELKLLAVRNEIPVIAISAVTDNEHDKRDTPPRLGQMAWSRAIEYDANLAIAVHRHDDSGLVEIDGVKVRNGILFNTMLEVDINKGSWKEHLT